MDKSIIEGINKLFNTISRLGYIDDSEINKLLVLSFIHDMLSGNLVYELTTDDYIEINNVIACIESNSCTIKDIPYIIYNVEEGEEPTDAIITTVNNIVKTIKENQTMVPQQGGTKKFTEFAYKPSFDYDAYIVGYDDSENTEIRVPAQNLGVYWMED